MRKIKFKIYKHHFTFVQAQLLLEYGFASKEPTIENTERVYYTTGNRTIWVPKIDENARFELGQRWETYRNFRANGGQRIKHLYEQGLPDRDEQIAEIVKKMKYLADRYIECFLMARFSYLGGSPLLRDQLRLVKRVGRILTEQEVRIRKGKRKRRVARPWADRPLPYKYKCPQRARKDYRDPNFQNYRKRKLKKH